MPGQEGVVIEELLGGTPFEMRSGQTEQGLGGQVGVGDIAVGVDGEHAGQH